MRMCAALFDTIAYAKSTIKNQKCSFAIKRKKKKIPTNKKVT